MDISVEVLIKDLVSAIIARDVSKVREILDNSKGCLLISMQANENFLHMICNRKCFISEEGCESSILSQKDKDIIYMLVDAGFDIENKDMNKNTCLFYAVKNQNPYICDILLQCGAEMFATTELDLSIQEYVEQNSSDEIKEVFRKYFPGIWRAVESEDIYQVRKLVNLWCRTELEKNGNTLKDIALNTGNEEIISLILGIFDSLRLVYHIYAKNTRAVAKLLNANHHRIRLELRKMSDRGAPILYYLIQAEDIYTIKLFIQYDCQLYTIMQDDQGCDMPVLFSAITSRVSVKVVKALLPFGKPHQGELLYKLLYRGQTVLEVALANHVDTEVFNFLIDRGGPLLLCDRNQMNQTVRDLAILTNKRQYVEAIDKTISSWILYPNKFPGLREKLSLYGWSLANAKEEFLGNSSLSEFFTHNDLCQVLMKQISEAIEIGNIDNFLQLKCYLSQDFLWHGNVMGDGMPLLHRAVLHNRFEIVEIILAEKPPKESIDNLYDQNRRTALHYAYASASMKDVRNILMTYGCSEHVLDKGSREPLDFRDKQDTELMTQLLHRLKSKEFATVEPDLWLNTGVTKKNEVEMLPCCQHDISTRETEECSSDYESDCTSDISEDHITTRSCTIF